MRRALALVLLVTLLSAGCAAPAPIGDEVGDLPRSMAALGDSITRGVNLDGAAPGEHPEASWATGNASFIANDSHAQRLVAMGALETGVHNFARSGARMEDFHRQARLAVDARAEYVAALFGANDACGGSSPEAFRAAFRAGADILREGLPRGATVYVVSVPNVTALWEIHHENERAQAAWRWFGVCPALLSQDADEADRARMTQRVEAFNRVLAEESARYGFHWDGGAVHRETLAWDDVSNLDYFHPSFSGQTRIAQATWRAGPFAE